MAIQLHTDGYQGYKGFAGVVPEGISFSHSRRVVHERLGLPSASGGGTVVKFFGKVPAWDRYDRSERSVHIQYADDETSVNLITISRPEFVS
jgi:hypothetical protein